MDRQVHPCPAGCCGNLDEGPCANKEKSIKEAQRLATTFFMPPKADPCFKSVALLLRRVIALKLGKQDTGPAVVEQVHTLMPP